MWCGFFPWNWYFKKAKQRDFVLYTTPRLKSAEVYGQEESDIREKQQQCCIHDKEIGTMSYIHWIQDRHRSDCTESISCIYFSVSIVLIILLVL